ncbi:uncharacterized protein LOC119066401 [Bradysia coprophila]|uniref:uncharacterized protein LOC119066401 n=1 Tax=Bradysia coprophila TaxID=38358 RepID=UPI00187D7BF8|nr:uncharacterized protein LOC119066401 [Bradysia coprophila]
MPNRKLRRAGDDLRIFKGKCFRDVNTEIQGELEGDEEIGEVSKVIEEAQPVDNRNYDEILLEAFDKVKEKSSKLQIEALSAICHQLQRHLIPDFLKEHIATITEIIECSFQRNIGTEVRWTAQLVVLCYIQLPEETRFIERFRPMVISAFDKQTYSVTVRSSLCKTAVVLVFLHKNHSNDLLDLMSKFEGIITDKTLVRVKDNIVTRTSQIDDLEIVVATLEAWTFLYTFMDSDTASAIDRFVRDLVALLKCFQFDLSIACARTIAVIYSCGDNDAKKFVDKNLLKIIDDISMIRRTVWPYTHNDKTKDLVLFYLKNGTIPLREIKIGNELLAMDTWSSTIQYDSLCTMVGAANMPKMLQENAFLLSSLKQSILCENESSLDNASLSELSDRTMQLHIDECMNSEIERIKGAVEKADGNLLLNFEDELLSLRRKFEFDCASSNVFFTSRDSIFRLFVLIMKRDKEPEKLIAIELATHVIVCLGEGSQFSQQIHYELLTELRHPEISASIVTKICTAFTFIAFLKNENLYGIRFTMDQMKNIFIGSFSKKRKVTSVNEATAVAMQCNALEGWSIILTILPQGDIRSALDNHGREAVNRHLDELLQSEYVELRTTAAETICLIIEHLRALPLDLHINSQLPKIIAVTNKHLKETNSKHMKAQHSRLQKVLMYLEKGVQPKYTFKVGKEQHELHTWSACLKYKKLCEIMGYDGLKIHLAANERLQSIIPIDLATISNVQSRLKRKV